MSEEQAMTQDRSPGSKTTPKEGDPVDAAQGCCAPTCCSETVSVAEIEGAQGESNPFESNPAQSVPSQAEAVVDQVRTRYGEIASGLRASCCETSLADTPEAAARLGYEKDNLKGVPEEADLGLGCGAPIEHLRLKPGEVVLDLGSGAGLDCFLAAPHVGPEGKVIGVDMTPEMLERANRNLAKTDFTQVEFRQGRLEELPVEDSGVDAVTSNCVINLVPDKSRVFIEIARTLRPGGRLVVSDIILDGPLPRVIENDLTAYVGCIAGAMPREAYFQALQDAGLGRIEILKDIDYLNAVGGVPAHLQELMDEQGVGNEDIEGIVRSVTYRAVKS